MTEKDTRRYERRRNIASVALATPSIRLVVVEAWAERLSPDEPPQPDGYRILPVLAIQATCGPEYTRRVGPDEFPHSAPTHREMVEFGWRYDQGGLDVEYDAIVLDDEYGLCDAKFACDCGNGEHQIVVCPWPSEEDVERLVEVIAEVGRKAVEKVLFRERSNAGAKP